MDEIARLAFDGLIGENPVQTCAPSRSIAVAVVQSPDKHPGEHLGERPPRTPSIWATFRHSAGPKSLGSVVNRLSWPACDLSNFMHELLLAREAGQLHGGEALGARHSREVSLYRPRTFTILVKDVELRSVSAMCRVSVSDVDTCKVVQTLGVRVVLELRRGRNCDRAVGMRIDKIDANVFEGPGMGRPGGGC